MLQWPLQTFPQLEKKEVILTTSIPTLIANDPTQKLHSPAASNPTPYKSAGKVLIWCQLGKLKNEGLPSVPSPQSIISGVNLTRHAQSNPRTKCFAQVILVQGGGCASNPNAEKCSLGSP